MKLRPIKTRKEYEAYLERVDELFDKKVKPNSTEGEELQIILLLIKQYEDKYYQIPTPDPIEAIKLKMAEKGLKNKDLVGLIGSKGYISSLLNGKKALTLDVAKIFHQKLGVRLKYFYLKTAVSICNGFYGFRVLSISKCVHLFILLPITATYHS